MKAHESIFYLNTSNTVVIHEYEALFQGRCVPNGCCVAGHMHVTSGRMSVTETALLVYTFSPTIPMQCSHPIELGSFVGQRALTTRRRCMAATASSRDGVSTRRRRRRLRDDVVRDAVSVS